MKVKNITSSVIGFGTVRIMPDEVQTISDSYADLGVFKAYKDLKIIEVIAEPVEVKANTSAEETAEKKTTTTTKKTRAKA